MPSVVDETHYGTGLMILQTLLADEGLEWPRVIVKVELLKDCETSKFVIHSNNHGKSLQNSFQ